MSVVFQSFDEAKQAKLDVQSLPIPDDCDFEG
jgi:hypothetical protein